MKNNLLHSVLINGVIFKEDKFLLAKRSMEEDHEAGKWSIPGGRVEITSGNVFDILQKTLIREIYEEVGIMVDEEMILVTNNSFIKESGQHVIAIVFLCKWVKGEPRALEDTSDVIWESIENLSKYKFSPNVRGYIEKAYDINKTIKG